MNYKGLQVKQSGRNTSACEAPDSKQAQTIKGIKQNASDTSHDAQQVLPCTQDCNELQRGAGETIGMQYISMQP